MYRRPFVARSLTWDNPGAPRPAIRPSDDRATDSWLKRSTVFLWMARGWSVSCGEEGLKNLQIGVNAVFQRSRPRAVLRREHSVASQRNNASLRHRFSVRGAIPVVREVGAD
jgi:hypothetical protein